MAVKIGEFRINPYEQADAPCERSKPSNGEEKKTSLKGSSLHAKPHPPGDESEVKEKNRSRELTIKSSFTYPHSLFTPP